MLSCLVFFLLWLLQCQPTGSFVPLPTTTLQQPKHKHPLQNAPPPRHSHHLIIIQLQAKEDSKNNSNDKGKAKEDDQNILKSLSFWSAGKEDAKDKDSMIPEKKDEPKQNWLGFLSRGNSTASKEEVDAQKEEKVGGGIIQGIKGRFSGGTGSSGDSTTDKLDIPEESKRRIPFQRSKATSDDKEKPPKKRRTLRIPRSSTTSSSSRKDKAIASSGESEEDGKWSNMLKRNKDEKGDRKADLEKSDDESNSSLISRFQQRLFGNATTSSDEDSSTFSTGKGKKTIGTAENTRSVASKYFSSFVDNTLSFVDNTRKSEEQWIPVCPKTRISPGEIVPVEAAGLELILVASKDGNNIYCMVNSCPHLGTPLETGILERRPIESKDTGSSNLGDPLPSRLPIQEADVAAMLTSDGCEDCIVCPLHRSAFSLSTGELRGEWCPYPPVLGKMMSTVKMASSAAVFDVRTRGKNIEVRINTPLIMDKKKKGDTEDGQKDNDDKDDKQGGGGKGIKLVI